MAVKTETQSRNHINQGKQKINRNEKEKPLSLFPRNPMNENSPGASIVIFGAVFIVAHKTRQRVKTLGFL